MKLTNRELTLCSGLLVAGMCVPPPGQKSSNTALVGQENQNKHKENNNVSGLPPTQDVKNSSGTEKQDGKQTPEQKQTHVIIDNVPQNKGWLEPAVISNIGLALIAVLTLGAIWYQARETARAADAAGEAASATKDAAIAAKKSADALINIERAWLIVNNFTSGDDFWNRVRGTAAQAGPKVAPTAGIKFVNFGHTPAWIVESALDLLASTIKDADVPITQHEKINDLPHHEAVPVGGNGYDDRVELRPSKFLSMTEIQKFEAGEKFIYSYGYIKYRDVFQKQTALLRETWWCYRLKFKARPNNFPDASWELCGPPGANQAT